MMRKANKNRKEKKEIVMRMLNKILVYRKQNRSNLTKYLAFETFISIFR